MKKAVYLICIGALAALGLTRSASASVVLYDSGGFESSAGYTLNNSLAGQPASSPTGQAPWGVSSNGTPVPSAIVTSYGSSTLLGGSQYVAMTDASLPAANVGDYFPTTFYQNPFTPSFAQGTNIVNVDWDMSVAPGATGAPFFGVDAYNGTTKLAQLGVNASTGAVVGPGDAATTVPAAALSNTFYAYQIQLDFSTDQYTLGMGAEGTSTYAPLGTYSFSGSTFTDADLESHVISGGGTSSGSAGFDNYSVVAVPEPDLGSVLAMGAVALMLWNRGRRTAL